ncbi:MAG: sulfatase atsG [Blastopirellula sp.]|nr:MAG: sulfatase atsG [Blastopirellula sp.]
MFRVLSFLTLLLCVTAVAASDRPNLVFIIADDCSHFDVGCYGGQALTPVLDGLAKQGMKFENCFQAAPMCSPTRHNIYTGLYPVKTGAYPNHTFAKAGTKSVVHYLKPLGYRVALSGKRHISPAEVFPFEFIGKGNNPDFAKVETFIQECQTADTPFCLFLTSNEPHSPWDKGDASAYDANKLTLPATFVDTPETRETMTRYLAEITYFDSQVGEALALLDKYKLADNTLVIATTEQGSSLPFAKWTCYDAGLQTGFIVRWPGKVQPNSISKALISYNDVLPTFIEAAGGKVPKKLDGKSLLPIFSGKTDKLHQYTFSEMTTRGIINGSDHYGIRSVRSLKYKYIWNFTPEVKFTNVVTMPGDTKWGESTVFNSWIAKGKTDADAAEKVRRYHYRPKEELYDITTDKDEWTNLADDPKYAKIKQQLRTELLAWMEETGDLGQPTELDAPNHQLRKQKKPSKK